MPLLQRVRIPYGILLRLGVPVTKLHEIQEKYISDEDKAVEECIEWWLEHATDVSWRKIIQSLDRGWETNVADGLRQYAEPPSGVIVF